MNPLLIPLLVLHFLGSVASASLEDTTHGDLREWLDFKIDNGEVHSLIEIDIALQFN